MKSYLLAASLTSILLSSPIHAATLGENLIINSGAEQGQGDGVGNAVGTDIPAIPGWTKTAGDFSVLKYGATGFDFTNPRGETVQVRGLPDASSPGPKNASGDPSIRGKNLFYGGAGRGSSGASQLINVADFISVIDAGQGRYNLSAWLGGYSTDLDNVELSLDFLNQDGESLNTAFITSPTPEERNNTTALLFKSTQGFVPVGSRQINVALDMNYVRGRVNDGYADNLSLVVTKVPEPSTLPLNLVGASCILFWQLLRKRRLVN